MAQFAWMPCLKELALEDNKISKVDGHWFQSELESLSLASNPIADVQDLLQLMSVGQSLQSIQLHSCPIAQQDGYREVVYERLPFLALIDGIVLKCNETLGTLSLLQIS
jgi:Leucine-rich repeat (LRR) protein